MINRRNFLGLLAAPAIVSAANIMPIKMYMPTLHLNGKDLDVEAWNAVVAGKPVLYKGERFTSSKDGPLVFPFPGKLYLGSSSFVMDRSLSAPRLDSVVFDYHPIAGFDPWKVPMRPGTAMSHYHPPQSKTGTAR